MLWHILYSLKEEKDIVSALQNKKHFTLPEEVIIHLSKLPEFSSQYASYSSKAIKKLLPLIRSGSSWNDKDILSRIDDYTQHLSALKERTEEGIEEDVKKGRKDSGKKSLLEKNKRAGTGGKLPGAGNLSCYLSCIWQA